MEAVTKTIIKQQLASVVETIAEIEEMVVGEPENPGISPEVMAEVDKQFNNVVEAIEEMGVAITDGTGAEPAADVAEYGVNTAQEAVAKVRTLLQEAVKPVVTTTIDGRTFEAVGKAGDAGVATAPTPKPKTSKRRGATKSATKPKKGKKMPSMSRLTAKKVDEMKRPMLMAVAVKLGIPGKGKVVELQKKIKAKLARRK